MPRIDTDEPDAPPREIELKFLLCDRDLEALSCHPEITRRLRTPLVEDSTRTVYYDTPERDLGNSRVTLRLRRKNGRHVQAVKADREGRRLASVRDEWEWTLPGPALELGLLKGRRLARLVPPPLRERLAPAYEAEILRREGIVELDGAVAALAFDRGTMRAGGRALPIRELEIELIEGAPEALYAFAATLAELAPMTIGTESKAEFGFRLLSGTRPEPRPAECGPAGALATLLGAHGALLDRGAPEAAEGLAAACRDIGRRLPALAADAAWAAASFLASPETARETAASSRYTIFLIRAARAEAL